MPGKQTRRSISVKGTTYQALKSWCTARERAMSDVVEEMLAKLFGAQPHPASSSKNVARPLANKVVRATPEVPASVGRPPPRSAREVVAERSHAPKGDYRSIRF
jgi:hypothetical protein